MGAPIFIGDEWTAVGYGLAGARILSPDEDRLDRWIVDAFEQGLRAAPPLLLITADYARRIDPARLDQARREANPPVAVVGDAAGRARPESPGRAIRRRMGVAE